MKNIIDFIKKNKANIAILLGAISTIVAAVATVDASHAVIYSIVIAVIAAMVAILKDGFTDATISLIAKAVQIIVEAMEKNNSVQENKVSAEAPMTIEEIEKRLRGRGTETEEAIAKRLKAIEFESQEAQHYDYKVVNDLVERAADEISKIYEKHKG